MKGWLRISLGLAYALLLGAVLLLLTAFGTDAATRLSKPDLTQLVTVHSDGTLRQNGLLVGRFLPDGDTATATLQIPVDPQDEPLNARVRLILPTSLLVDVQPQAISIQGPIHLATAPDLADANALDITLPGLLADAHTELRLTAPASDFTFSWGTRLLVWLKATDEPFWATLIVLFLLAGGFSFLAALPRTRPGAVDQTLIKGIAPAEAAILTHGSLHPSDIAAVLFDLGQRGYLQFIQRPSQDEVLIFRSSRGEGELRTYEQWVLNILAPKAGQPQSVRQALTRLDRGVFSQAVGAVYVEAYRLFTDKGYVTANPRLLHLRWKTAGIAIQLLGALTAVIAYLTASPIADLPLAGLAAYAAGLAVYHAASRILPLSEEGERVHAALQGLRAYLAQPQPVTTLEGSEGALLYRLMPYALVLGVEMRWGDRFATTRCVIPPWFSTEVDVYDAGVFVTAVDGLTRALAAAVAKFKDPNVD